MIKVEINDQGRWWFQTDGMILITESVRDIEFILEQLNDHLKMKQESDDNDV